MPGRIAIPLQGPPISAATTLLSPSSGSRSFQKESDLLRSIRIALRGTGTDVSSTVQSTTFETPSEPWGEQQITWNNHTVILSAGGLIRKKWNFEEEGQCIQWVCHGWIEQADLTGFNEPHENVSSSQHDAKLFAERSQRPTFGPFTQARKPGQASESTTICPAIFVFLRSIGKIYLSTGQEYTFSLPFIVRKAWPLSPHGVMIQRVLEPTEVEECLVTGDDVLPTIFSVTSPFAEPSAVGLTLGIQGGYNDVPPALKDEEENSTKPLKSIPPSEMIIWASHRCVLGQEDVLVTVNPDKRQLSLWRYTYIRPKDTPVPLERARSSGGNHKRQSMISVMPTSRRHSAIAPDSAGLKDRISSLAIRGDPPDISPTIDHPELPPLSALPGMPPSLSTTTTMASLVTAMTQSQSQSQSQQPRSTRARRNSLTRNDLSVTLNRMALGGRIDADINLAPIEHGRMKASFWMEKLYQHDLPEDICHDWHTISASLFDQRWDGDSVRSLLSICFPTSSTAQMFLLTQMEDHTLKVTYHAQVPAISVTALRATRHNVSDLLVVEPDNTLVIFTHDLVKIPIHITTASVEGRMSDGSFQKHGDVIAVQDCVLSTVSLRFRNGSLRRITVDLIPRDELTVQTLCTLALTLPAQEFSHLHQRFLEIWSENGLRTSDSVEFDALTQSLYETFDLIEEHLGPSPKPSKSLWESLADSPSYSRFAEDPALRSLHGVPGKLLPLPTIGLKKPHQLLAPLLAALNMLGEDIRVTAHRYEPLLQLAPIIFKVALLIRPEWADYWKRLCPDVTPPWPSPQVALVEFLDDRLPVWPPDFSAVLFGRISNPEWKVPSHEIHQLAIRFNIKPSFAYGQMEPLPMLRQLTAIFKRLSDKNVPDIQKRAENAIHYTVTKGMTGLLKQLPFGIAIPLREAARTCQLAPPEDWPLEAYQLIGRNDLATSALAGTAMDLNPSAGYKAVKKQLNSPNVRAAVSTLVTTAKAAGAGEVETVTGVNLDLEEFTDIRFGQDRRLEEVSRMLCSSAVASVRMPDRGDLSEHDQAKEQQHQVVRIAERTLALPYGRAMFTFGSVPRVTRQAYAIPKLEYSIRIRPMNITIVPETGKIPPECTHWGEFHNGVAAGLRISPFSTGVDSSWITFNKPSELTPEHAGFLYGLGLAGHLKWMLTWHTFGYLTPKHDLTSIGVLLGLAASNVGSGNQHVTKLLAVHTPALLPTPTVDLNVSLMTQAAGLAGVGLLYMGTKNRRMAEVCLSQISRKDLVQPDLSNEHREAYTHSAALAFGMIMLGKGSLIPADLALLDRLGVLIHGDVDSMLGQKSRATFDLNLTSPAATIAMGLMYLRTERQDIADMLTIPDTVLTLNRLQPSFLLMRTVARSLIMWNAIQPSNDWLKAQIPPTIAQAMEARFQHNKPVDDALELAYYNILAGCCFAIGLKYAGTARQEAYMMIITYFDMFSRLVYSSGPAFDHKIKRSAVREGLNLISIALSMVMAGTGEISCFRRLRYAYGMYHQSFRYGIHVATHLSIGLLFLGGGRFTLGTSDAAVACMVTAFFPRFHHVSSDNKSFLQALRHLWVLAVEPRCLTARDVDTKEVVYLPVKITVREGQEVGTTQLISPTLIPDLDKLVSIRVDTPRYWPFHLDIENVPRHKANLLQNQTLHVKRRTAFLSYTEDPRGSRSMFVRSGSSAGDAATLDFPQLTDTQTHPAGDLSQFISSFSNDVLFLAFADHFARQDGETADERLFHTYCHAALLDSILQDKPQTLQSHLTLFLHRTISSQSRHFHLKLQDLRFASDFYSKVYDRRFSGRSENNTRPPLVRETTVSGVLHALDQQLDAVRVNPNFVRALGQYSRGESISDSSPAIERQLAWYLLRDGVPVSTLLVILKGLARDAHAQCLGVPPPEGTQDVEGLDMGIKEVLHATGTKMTTALGSGWSVRSLDEVITAWK